MRSVAEVWANSRIRDPGREQAIAWSTMPRAETATITRSAPRPPVRRLTSEATSIVRGSQANSAPHLRRHPQSLADGIGGRDARAPALHQHGKHQPNRPLPQDDHEILRLRIALHHGLQTRVQGLHQSGALEGNSGGNSLHAALHYPVHYPHVLSKPSARRLEARRNADFLVHRALGVNLAPAIEAFQAGDVMKCHHPVARPVFRDARPHRRHNSSRFVTVHPRRRQQVVLDLLEVGVTDATSFHPYQNLATPDGGCGNLLNADHALPAIDGCVHSFGYSTRVRIGSLQKNPPGLARPALNAGAAGTVPAAGPKDGAMLPLRTTIVSKWPSARRAALKSFAIVSPARSVTTRMQ